MTPEDIVWELRRLADSGDVHPYALRQLADRIELGGLLGRTRPTPIPRFREPTQEELDEFKTEFMRGFNSDYRNEE